MHSTFIAYLSYRAQMVPIAGFLLTGVLIGPGGLGLVSDIELVDQMAEIGVILLLFTLGLDTWLREDGRFKILLLAYFTGGFSLLYLAFRARRISLTRSRSEKDRPV